MATGSGKTFTAITAIYRLLKFAKAKRVLFLVDTKNLGEQAEQEFMAYTPSDDNRKFTELYTVQRLKSSYVATDSQVCICTIQRLYSILKDEPLDETLDELNPAEQLTRPKKPLPVVYSEKIPPEFFDFIVIDECHRSIYNLWQQVLDYYDAFLVGLTATPDNRTYAFFRKNIVSDYSHEKAVADGVNVGNEVYVIENEASFVEGVPRFAPLRVWSAYRQLENYQGQTPLNELTALVALIRRASGLDKTLTPFDDTVRKNFQTWIMQRHAGPHPKFTEPQLAWLQMIRDHVTTSFHFERDDLDLAPFDAHGGLGKMYQLFGAQMDPLIAELNEALVA